MGYRSEGEGVFMARRRHLNAIHPHGRAWKPRIRTGSRSNCLPKSCAWRSALCRKSPANSAPTTCWAKFSAAFASANRLPARRALLPADQAASQYGRGLQACRPAGAADGQHHKSPQYCASSGLQRCFFATSGLGALFWIKMSHGSAIRAIASNRLHQIILRLVLHARAATCLINR